VYLFVCMSVCLCVVRVCLSECVCLLRCAFPSIELKDNSSIICTQYMTVDEL
jgi:hypothetical protein